MEEVKTFCFCDLVEFLEAEQADDTPEEKNITWGNKIIVSDDQQRVNTKESIERLCFYLTTGTFLLVRNSRAISMSSNRTGQPQYSSHLPRNATARLSFYNPTWHSCLQVVRLLLPHQDP